MIVFNVVGTAPDEMLRKENDHPYVIAYGLSMDNILTFYVEIEKHLFPVSLEIVTNNQKLLIHFFIYVLQMPSDWSTNQVFDFYFKAHKIFNLKFDPVIENAMTFIQTYFYHVSDGSKKPTQAMKELIHNLKADVDSTSSTLLENE